MRHPITLSLKWLLVLAGAAAVGSPSFADDRDLLYSQKAATPNVMVIISNSTTMRNIPATTTIDPLGQSDGPNSKMGIAKAALNNIIKNNPGFNWGLSSFSYGVANFLSGGTKHFIFQPTQDSFTGKAYNRPAGTKVNFGGAGYTTVKYGTTTYAKVSWVAPSTVNGIAYDPTSAPLTDTDTLHLPFNGKDGQMPMLIVGAGGDPTLEIVFKISTPNTAPYAITTAGQMKIQEDVYTCPTGITAPCDPATASHTDFNNNEPYVIPPEYCREDNNACYYPQIFGYGADAGKEIGWVSTPTASNLGSLLGDWSKSSGNASGWLTQAVSDPQPITMIPRDYTPWTPYPGSIPTATQQTYVESSTPCLVRALRPAASTVHYSSSNAYSNTDDFPRWDPNTGLPGGNMTACDKMVDGYYQAGVCLTCTNASQALAYPVFTTRNGNVAPLQGILKTDAYRYFNGVTSGGCSASKAVDMFCGGARVDDPFGGCRHDYIILLTDSFVQQSAITKSDVAGLFSIGVRVFVIGFGVGGGDVGPIPYCTLGDAAGTPGNAGQCIADWTGATTYDSHKNVVQEGYFNANKPGDLITALNSILNELNESNRDFATATIPSVSSTSEGVGYLSEFQPQNNHSIWRGHLRAFYLDPVTGLLQTSGYPDYKPSLVQFQFGSGSTQPTGSLVWEAGNPDPTPGATVPTGILSSSVAGFTNPNTILTAGTAWSDAVHDQATVPQIGRNVFFGVKPGDTGCGSTTYQCLFQAPVGLGGSTTEPYAVTTPPNPLPGWWATVRDGSAYANVPNPLVIQNGSEAANNRDQALQNSFSFLRGNRDPVVEDLKLSGKFDATHTHCSDLSSDPDTPCYDGDILGDIFHSNPVVVSFPNNVRYYFAQDPGAGSFGTYADRGGTCTFAGNSIPCSSYQLFFLQHAHRRKILYAGGDDGLMHAFDIGVYNGDASSYTPTGQTNAIQPFLNHYDLGSGREIFGYAPGAGLNKAYQLGHTLTQDWTIDGPANADDVYIDVANVGGTPRGIAPSGAGGDLPGTNPKWRTVLVGIEREGGLVAAGGGISSGISGNGGSVFAMDVTAPDQAAHMGQDDGGGHTGSPECLVNNFVPGTDSPASGCTDGEYPRILWEMRDDQVTSPTTPQPAELSTSAEATTQDLGMTWSRPVLGRVKLNVSSGTARDFFVAIFGGGYDHTAASISAANTSGNTGNYLYMVDIETGKIIYKKNLGLWNSGASGSNSTGNLAAGLPGEPAVIDLNGDGYLDRIYIGDTQGRLWKVDLTTSATMNGSNMVQASDWNPTLMFDEFQTAAPPLGSVRQPIFTRPSVFLVNTSTSGTPRLGVAFGTGDRDNMPILADTHSNWFVVVVDDPTVTYPVYLSTMTQASLTANPSPCTATNCMNANGYYLVLNQPSGTGGAQIVNTNSLAFNQAIYFNTFLRTTTPGNCNQLGEAFLYKIDYLTGESLYTVNGNPVANEQATGGAEVASDPIVYEDVNSWVVSATDTTSVQNVGGGTPPAVNIKSWKEQ